MADPDGGWDKSRIDQAHPVAVTSVSWGPSIAPGALVGTGLLDPVQKLASGGCDNTVKVRKFDNETWRLDCFPTLSMHSNWVRDVSWEPNLGLAKSTIASASQDGKVIIWTSLKEGDQWNGKVLKDFKTPVWRVSWSLTGNILAVADGQNTVTLERSSGRRVSAGEAAVAEGEQVAMSSPRWGYFRIIAGTVIGGMIGFYYMHRAELKYKEMWNERLRKYEEEMNNKRMTEEKSDEFQESS